MYSARVQVNKLVHQLKSTPKQQGELGGASNTDANALNLSHFPREVTPHGLQVTARAPPMNHGTCQFGL